jgi:plasmid stabilization system protein ParE
MDDARVVTKESTQATKAYQRRLSTSLRQRQDCSYCPKERGELSKTGSRGMQPRKASAQLGIPVLLHHAQAE